MKPVEAPLTRHQKIQYYLCLIVLTVVVILLTGEFVTRLFVTQNPIPSPPAPMQTIDPYSPNPYITWGRPYLHFHIPGSHYTQARSYYKVAYQINASGFRGADPPYEKRKKHRLAIIGDSIVEGHGCPVDQTFPARLDEKAKKTEWEVLNLGVQGASPSYYAANLERYLSYSPDAVMLLLFENDLYDDRIQEAKYLSLPILDTPNRLLVGYTPGIVTRLIESSRLFLLLQRVTHTIRLSQVERLIVQNSAVNVSNSEQETLNTLSPWLVAPSMLNDQWRLSRRYLNYIAENLKKRKISLHLLFISLGALAPGNQEIYRVHVAGMEKKIRQWAEDNGVPFLSLVPLIEELLRHHPPNKIMIHNDGHPTPYTHQQIADRIWSALVEKPVAQSSEQHL